VDRTVQVRNNNQNEGPDSKQVSLLIRMKRREMNNTHSSVSELELLVNSGSSVLPP